MTKATCRVVTGATRRNLREIIAAELPGGPFRHIMIKPNWVLHQTNGHFPIAALVTSARLIEETIEASLGRHPAIQASIHKDFNYRRRVSAPPLAPSGRGRTGPTTR